jgi:hypothetical protein
VFHGGRKKGRFSSRRAGNASVSSAVLVATARPKPERITKRRIAVITAKPVYDLAPLDIAGVSA